MIRNTRSRKLDEIHYLLGNSCNLSCDFCFWDSKLPDFSLKFKKKIVDQIVSTGIKKVTVSGGEPLCDKDFMEVLAYMHKSGLEIILHTNGLKITQRSLKKIAAFISRVSLTMDSIDEDILFQMRKNRDITRHTIFLVKQFYKLGILVSIKTLITKINSREIMKIGKVINNLPLQYWSLFEFIPVGRGKTNKDKFYISPKLFDKICTNLKNEFPSLSIRIRRPKQSPNKYCFIAANGKVYTYDKDAGDIFVGDLDTENLSSIILRI